MTLRGAASNSPELIGVALSDPDPGVRRHAVRLAEPRAASFPALAEKAVLLADDPDPFVRLQLAYTLGAWPDRLSAATH